MTTFKPHTRAVFAALLLGGATACATAAPPPHAPAHGYRAQTHYSYVYYPRAQVYYAPDRRYWYWRSSQGWRYGHALPRNYAHLTVGGVSISLADSVPYRHHGTVRSRYGYQPSYYQHRYQPKKPKNKHRQHRGRGYWDGRRRR